MTLQLQMQQMPGYLAARFTGVYPLYTIQLRGQVLNSWCLRSLGATTFSRCG